MRVAITVDFEPDCPPFLQGSFRGVDEGGPALLDLLRDQGVHGTYFVTAEVARRSPDAVAAIVSAGHELGSHGVTHRAFDRLSPDEARAEIEDAAACLRVSARVTSFRAPYLRFPDAYVRMLADAGFSIDASLARYKAGHRMRAGVTQGVTRVAASVTSSVLRLPRAIRDPWLLSLADPVVLFVHPWEFVDLRRTKLRYDCRFRTGADALRSLREVIALFAERDAAFIRIRELAGSSGVSRSLA